MIGGLDANAHRRLVHEIALEHEAVCPVRVIDEGEVGAHRSLDPELVVGGLPCGGVGCLEEFLEPGVEEGEVEIKLARKVLIEDGLGDAGPFGDDIHARRVVARLDEHGPRGIEHLGAALLLGHARGGNDAHGRMLATGENRCATGNLWR